MTRSWDKSSWPGDEGPRDPFRILGPSWHCSP